jgi:hypothetical protein
MQGPLHAREKQQDKAKRNKQQGGWVGGTSLFRKVMTIDKEISESHEGGWGGGLKETTSEHVCLHTCIYGLRQNE